MTSRGTSNPPRGPTWEGYIMWDAWGVGRHIYLEKDKKEMPDSDEKERT